MVLQVSVYTSTTTRADSAVDATMSTTKSISADSQAPTISAAAQVAPTDVARPRTLASASSVTATHSPDQSSSVPASPVLMARAAGSTGTTPISSTSSSGDTPPGSDNYQHVAQANVSSAHLVSSTFSSHPNALNITKHEQATQSVQLQQTPDRSQDLSAADDTPMNTPTRSSFLSSVAGQRPLPSLSRYSSQSNDTLTVRNLSQPREDDDDAMDVDDDEDSEDDNHAMESGESSAQGRKKSSHKFYCVDYPPCNLNFTRSEHLARHIRYGILRNMITPVTVADRLFAENTLESDHSCVIATASSLGSTTSVSMLKPYMSMRIFQLIRSPTPLDFLGKCATTDAHPWGEPVLLTEVRRPVM